MNGIELAAKHDKKIIEYYLTMLEKGEGTKKLLYSSMFDYELGLDNEENENKIKKIPKYTQGIRQEIDKIYQIIGRLQEGLDHESSINRKAVCVTLDIDLFLVKYRIVLGYLIDIIKFHYGNTLNKELKKYRKLEKQEKGKKKSEVELIFDFLKMKAQENNLETILIDNSWFYSITKNRNDLVHNAYTCVAFDSPDHKKIPFQIYDLDVDPVIYDLEYLLANEKNLYDFRYFFVVYMSYLHCFIIEIFYLLGANHKTDEELEVFQEILRDSMGAIPNKEISLKWTENCIKSLKKLFNES
ncbi:hypothetical protein CN982_21805 [Bacillus cereus]|uniref:hypothetical protein n=1 Tax=Bacillus cereus TaxID=1396 RepID=UPI000BFC9B6E|nr:hypothetical protein [Bacillus cereus]PGO25237.1 hypothetical protein CN982_21805 [Bacillus cereus]